MRKLIHGVLIALFTLTALPGCKADDTVQQPFTVTFNTDGGNSIQSQEVEEGGKIIQPTDPTKEGFHFAGWFKEAACTNEWRFETDVVTKAMTLYAKWTTVTFTVTFNTDGGSNIKPILVTEGSTVQKPSIPIKTDFVFEAWFKEAACTNLYDFSTPITADLTLYAKWGVPLTTEWISCVKATTDDWLNSKHPLVYVGHADPWDHLYDGKDHWKFVQDNADGLYINFILPDFKWMSKEVTLSKMKPVASLMKKKDLFYEADQHDGLEERDKTSLEVFQEAGLKTAWTSYNYTINFGWVPQRAETLRSYALDPGQARRECLVLVGPWEMSGDILAESKTNAEIRRQANELADGIATDGPLGFWFNNYNKVRSATYSIVDYMNQAKKTSALMLAPYDAGVQGYECTRDFLKTGIDCVKKVENQSGSPDIWTIWEYAVTYPATPEANSDGSPANTTTGMAYWLIKHLQGEGVSLKINQQTGTSSFSSVKFSLQNECPWASRRPVIKAQVDDLSGWNLKLFLDGEDVTSVVFSENGLRFVDEQELAVGAKRSFAMELIQTNPSSSKKPTVTLQVIGHPDVDYCRQVWTVQ